MIGGKQVAISAYTSALTNGQRLINVYSNTPAMPLLEAHFGGFFVSGRRQ